MPDLDYAVLCDYVRTETTGVAHIIAAGIDTLTATEAPSGFNIGVALRVLFGRSECDRPHRLELLIQSVDGERLGQVNGSIVPLWPDGLPVHWKTGSAAALNFGISLPVFGDYSVDVLLNDSLVKTLPFRFRESAS